MIKKIKTYFKEFDEKRLIKWVLIGSGIIVLYFIIKLIYDGYWIWGKSPNYEVTGQVGDFIGGFIGTVFSAAGFYLVYVTLREQRKSFERERFETRFFEMLKIYKENVNELNYTEKHLVKVDSTTKRVIDIKNKYQGRKVFKSIYYDFTLLYNELSSFFKDVDEIYKIEYKADLLNNGTIKDRKIDLLEFARLDITYCIIFFGLSSQDRRVLINIFGRRYKEGFIKKIVAFSALKPKEHSKFFKFFNGLDDTTRLDNFNRKFSELQNSGKDLISIKGHSNLVKGIFNLDEGTDRNYEKYYGGHQFRLGHYYRHLYQTINYINENKNLSYPIKYENIKLLRTQISTFEQRLIFLNSVSTMGRVWELEKIGINSEVININQQLITKYNFLKNVPDDILFDTVKISNYYPSVILETNYDLDDAKNRKDLEKQYK